jgi:preprotein translocase subunit Sec63
VCSTLYSVQKLLLKGMSCICLPMTLSLLLSAGACSVNRTAVMDGTCLGAACVEKTEVTKLCPLDKCGEVGHMKR